MKHYTAPKAIVSHPAVETCDYGPDSGVEDYKHDVWLREGYVFRFGRMAGCRGGHFKTVRDFLHAEPTNHPDIIKFWARD